MISAKPKDVTQGIYYIVNKILYPTCDEDTILKAKRPYGDQPFNKIYCDSNAMYNINTTFITVVSSNTLETF